MSAERRQVAGSKPGTELTRVPTRHASRDPVTRRERLTRERHRLVLGASDMRQVAAACDYLQAVTMNDSAERCLWTGIVVTYARPYGRNRIGAIRGRLAQPEDAALFPTHDSLIARRHDLFAHTDDTAMREVVDAYEALGFGAGHHVERYQPIDPAALPRIAQLARDQERRFNKRYEEIQAELARLP